MSDELIFEPVTITPLEFLTDIQGQSLYKSWLELGFEGSTADFLAWLKGSDGKSQYQSYLDTTTDNPVLTEAEWSNLFETKENTGVAAQLIDDLKANVSTDGDTLKKLLDLINLKINASETLTATEIQLLISNLVDSSPEHLNTLKELADALNDDPNFATTITTLISQKVTAIAGYSLTKNDLTDALKTAYDLAVTKSHTAHSDDETVQSVGTLINSAATKDTLVDTDMIPVMDSADGNKLKKWSFLKMIAQLSTIFSSKVNPNFTGIVQSSNFVVYHTIPFASGTNGSTGVNITNGTTVTAINGNPFGPNGLAQVGGKITVNGEDRIILTVTGSVITVTVSFSQNWTNSAWSIYHTAFIVSNGTVYAVHQNSRNNIFQTSGSSLQIVNIGIMYGYVSQLYWMNGSGGKDLSLTEITSTLLELNNGTPGITRDLKLRMSIETGILEYADNAAALAAGLTAGMKYRTGDLYKIVH